MSKKTVLRITCFVIIGYFNVMKCSVPNPVSVPVPVIQSQLPVAPQPGAIKPPVPVTIAQPIPTPTPVPVAPNPRPIAPVATTVLNPAPSQPVPIAKPVSIPAPVALPAPAPVVAKPVAMPVPQSVPVVPKPVSVTPMPTPVSVAPVAKPAVSPAPVPTAVSGKKEDALDLELDESQDIGLSTVELEEAQGNWLYKRLWWERAENRFERIRALIDAIWSLRSDFFTKRTELDKTVLDPFYLFIGAGQGEFREIVGDIIKRLQKSQQTEGDLDEQERALLADLQDQKKELDTMQKSIDAILTLDHDVDIALSRLMEQLNRARDYEKEAWQSLKDIARELSDKKAQDIFYHMETIWKNLKGVHKYIQGEFANHFNDLIKKVTNEANTTKQIVQKLKTKGIDLKDRADKLEEADRTAHDRAIEKKAQEEAAKKEKEIQQEEEPESEEHAEQGWVEWLISFPESLWNNIKILLGL